MRRESNEHSEVDPISGIRYLALGDSTGAGVGSRSGGYVDRLFRKITTRRPGSLLINICVSGATTLDVLADQVKRIANANPNLVTLSVGINDISHGISLDQFEKNYDEILRHLTEQTEGTVIATNIPEISSAPRIPRSMRSHYRNVIDEYNQRLEASAALSQVTVFDIYSITHQQLPDHPEYFSADGFHPSDKGYELWSEAMWPIVAQSIGPEAAVGI
jgi:acyl-CoA thioesterase I